jgi:prolyl 4-hydroxylase
LNAAIDTMASADTSVLMGWLKEQLARGCTSGSLMQSMLDSGWSLADASDALLKAALPDPGQGEGMPSAPVVVSAALAVAPAAPKLKLGEANVVRAHDRDVRILMDMTQPHVVVVADLLSPDECGALIEAARGRLQRSQTVSAQEAITAEVHSARTSEGMFFQTGESELIRLLEARIAALFNWPVDHAEGLQVLRYTPGAEYRPHFDHFDLLSPGGQTALSRGGQRVGTVVVYLATPEGGGATVFPDQGLQVRAQAGHAVFFSYDLNAGEAGVLHGGAPVTGGEKWVATKWLREKKFA